MEVGDRQIIVGDAKLAIVAVHLFVEAILAGIAPILQESRWPNEFQIASILVVALLASITYVVSIIRG